MVLIAWDAAAATVCCSSTGGLVGGPMLLVAMDAAVLRNWHLNRYPFQ